MLKRRNRPQGSPSELHQCLCGRVVTESRPPGGGFILIHEQPWCVVFERIIAKLQATYPSAQLHQAAMLVESETGASETILTADGDTVAEVNAPVTVSRGGKC